METGEDAWSEVSASLLSLTQVAVVSDHNRKNDQPSDGRNQLRGILNAKK